MGFDSAVYAFTGLRVRAQGPHSHRVPLVSPASTPLSAPLLQLIVRTPRSNFDFYTGNLASRPSLVFAKALFAQLHLALSQSLAMYGLCLAWGFASPGA